MRTITIEVHDNGYTVREGDRYHDELCWDEMLGQVTELTHPRLGDGRYAMKTEAEWASTASASNRVAIAHRTIPRCCS
jgi:hypothetical protein